MDLLEITQKQEMKREQAAELLHKLADSLARHNSVNFDRDGLKFHIDVPDEVTVEFEVEIEDDKSSVEVEISW